MKVEIEICPDRDKDVWHCDLVITHGRSVFKSRWEYYYNAVTSSFNELGGLSEALAQFSKDLNPWSISERETKS